MIESNRKRGEMVAKCEIPAIPISFKNTQEDIELRDWIIRHSNRSGFVKDILREKMEEEKQKKQKIFQRL